MVKSDWAPQATASAAWMVPLTTPGGNPVMAGVGQVPRSPLRRVGPVLVTPAPASTAKLPAVPSGTGAGAAPARLASTTATKPTATTTRFTGTRAIRRPTNSSR